MQYRVKAGMYFGASREYGPGAVVTLDPNTARRFLDKLEPIPGSENVMPPQDPGLENSADVVIPEEMKLFHSVAPEDAAGGIQIDLEGEEKPAEEKKPRKRKSA